MLIRKIVFLDSNSQKDEEISVENADSIVEFLRTTVTERLNLKRYANFRMFY